MQEMILFLKAQRKGAADKMGDLFETMTHVDGSVDQAGHVTKPHWRRVKKKVVKVKPAKPAAQLDLFGGKPPKPAPEEQKAITLTPEQRKQRILAAIESRGWFKQGVFKKEAAELEREGKITAGVRTSSVGDREVVWVKPKPEKPAEPKPAAQPTQQERKQLERRRQFLQDTIETRPKDPRVPEWKAKIAKIDAAIGPAEKPADAAPEQPKPVDQTGWSEHHKAAYALLQEYQQRPLMSGRELGAFKRRVHALAKKTPETDEKAVMVIESLWTKLVGSDYDPKRKDPEYAKPDTTKSPVSRDQAGPTAAKPGTAAAGVPADVGGPETASTAGAAARRSDAAVPAAAGDAEDRLRPADVDGSGSAGVVAGDEPKEGDTKTENGITYELRDGRWHRVTAEDEAAPALTKGEQDLLDSLNRDIEKAQLLLRLKDPQNRNGKSLPEAIKDLGYNATQADVLSRQTKQQLRDRLNSLGEQRRKLVKQGQDEAGAAAVENEAPASAPTTQPQEQTTPIDKPQAAPTGPDPTTAEGYTELLQQGDDALAQHRDQLDELFRARLFAVRDALIGLGWSGSHPGPVAKRGYTYDVKHAILTKDDGKMLGVEHQIKASHDNNRLLYGYVDQLSLSPAELAERLDAQVDKAAPEPIEPALQGLEDDVPLSLATDAHRNTSFTPERRARQRQFEYVEQMKADYAQLKVNAEQGRTQSLLDEEFGRYRAKQRELIRAALSADANTASPMITGPARFPSARNEKRMETAHKRWQAVIDHREKAMAAIRNRLRPDLAPPRSKDEVIDDIQSNLAAREAKQVRMKAANKLIRSKQSDERKVAGLVDLGISAAEAHELLKPDVFGRPGYPDYLLKNNNAEIRRLKQRLESEQQQVQAAQDSGTEFTFDGGTVVLDPDDNRLRLLFDGKPDEDTRAKLKANGFRWAPSQGAWQRQLTENAKRAAARVVGVDFSGAAKEASADTVAGPQEGDTKTEGGVTYVLRDGRWHRVDEAAPEERQASTPPATETARQPAGDDDPNSPNYRYRDQGYVAGSRKELAAEQLRAAKRDKTQVRKNDIDWQALEENPRAAKEVITKSHLFGSVPWEQHKSTGMEPGAGFLIDRVYAAVGTGPVDDTPQARQDYALGIESLRDRLEACKTPTAVHEVLKEIRDERDGVNLDPDEAEQYAQLEREATSARAPIRAYQKREHELSLEHARALAVLRVLVDTPKRQRGLEYTTDVAKADDAADRAADALQAFRDAHPEMQEVTTTTRTDRGISTRWHRPAEEQWRAIKAKQREIVSQALARNTRESQALRAWKQLGQRFNGVLDAGRRGGSDTFDKHLATAKLGRVKDWSWLEKDAKQPKGATKQNVRFQLAVAEQHARVGGRDVSVDSTKALQERFKFRAVQSGNWVLKDVASAKFHVEQSAGALADLADIIGAKDAEISINGRLAMAFGARGRGGKGAFRAHYEPVEQVINLTKMGGGGSMAHEWFHGLDNLLLEAHGHQAGIDRYLSEQPSLLPAGPVRAAFTALSEALTRGDHQHARDEIYTPDDHRLATLNLSPQRSRNSRSIQSRILQAGNVHAAVAVVESVYASKPKSKNAKLWRQIAIAHYGGNENGGVVKVKSGPKGSRLFADGVKLDEGQHGKYWSSTREMAARAFQSYVEDKLAEQGRQNDYLSAGADNENPAYRLFGHRPFPDGDERKRINAAFDQLFSALAADNTLAKAIARLSRITRPVLFLSASTHLG